MDTIIGIDLGTTNSEVAVIRDGQPVVLEEAGDPILPSVVGLDPQGRLLRGDHGPRLLERRPAAGDPRGGRTGRPGGGPDHQRAGGRRIDLWPSSPGPGTPPGL